MDGQWWAEYLRDTGIVAGARAAVNLARGSAPGTILAVQHPEYILVALDDGPIVPAPWTRVFPYCPCAAIVDPPSA